MRISDWSSDVCSSDLVIDVALQVVFVADQMLPIPPLPDPAFAFGDAACAAMLASGNVARKPAFDLAPAHGVAGIAGRQRPHGVQVVGQNDHGVDGADRKSTRLNSSH